MIKEWIDELDNEEELMCLDWHEYHDKEPYFVDIGEVKEIFRRQIEDFEEENAIKTKKLTENRYEIAFNGDVLYFICPLNATEEVKSWWKELKWLFEEYK